MATNYPPSTSSQPKQNTAEQEAVEQELKLAQDELAWELKKAAVDVAGIVDPTPISDAVGAGMSLAEGDLLGAGLSLISIVPYVGDALGKTTKGARAAAKINKLKNKIVESTRKLNKVINPNTAAKNAENTESIAEELYKNTNKLINDCPRADKLVEEQFQKEKNAAWEKYLKKKKNKKRLGREEWEKKFRDNKKGVVGEHIVDNDLVKKKGLEKVNDGGKPVDLNDSPKGTGIDGIYKNPKPRPDYYVVEAKYDKAKLNSQTGQMSDEWLHDPNRLNKAFEGNRKMRDDFVNSSKKGDVEKLVGKVDPDGTVTYIRVNAEGKLAGEYNKFP